MLTVVISSLQKRFKIDSQCFFDKKSLFVQTFIMFSFLAQSLPLPVNQRSIETGCHLNLFWVILIATSRRSLLGSSPSSCASVT